MTDLDPNAKQINGIVNVIRLEGKINAVDKIIYVFMGFNTDIQQQTQCTNIFAKDIKKYFVDSFQNLHLSAETYDFFLNIQPSSLASTHDRFLNRDGYMDEVQKMFRRLFEYDEEQNKVNMPKLFQNIRLHYFDIKPYITLNVNDQLREIFSMIDQLWPGVVINPHSLSDIEGVLNEARINILNVYEKIYRRFIPVHDEKLNDLSSFIDKLGVEYFIDPDHLLQVEQLISEIKNDIKPKTYQKFKWIGTLTDADTNKKMEALIYKLAKLYQNEHIGVEIENIWAGICKFLIDIVRFEIPMLIKEIRTFRGDIIQTAGKNTINSEYPWAAFHNLDLPIKLDHLVKVTDTYQDVRCKWAYGVDVWFENIYFLRRFLDKDYIRKAIMYGNGAYSNGCVWSLVKYFDFKITHASYSAIPDYDKLMETIKELSFDQTYELWYLLYPPNLQQCADVSKFPDSFA